MFDFCNRGVDTFFCDPPHIAEGVVFEVHLFLEEIHILFIFSHPLLFVAFRLTI